MGKKKTVDPEISVAAEIPVIAGKKKRKTKKSGHYRLGIKNLRKDLQLMPLSKDAQSITEQAIQQMFQGVMGELQARLGLWSGKTVSRKHVRLAFVAHTQQLLPKEVLKQALEYGDQRVNALMIKEN